MHLGSGKIPAARPPSVQEEQGRLHEEIRNLRKSMLHAPKHAALGFAAMIYCRDLQLASLAIVAHPLADAGVGAHADPLTDREPR